MNKDEQRAETYLKSLDYENIEYEPIKNETPDFLLDNKIAVEVRRLNINYINEKISHGIEDFVKPLEDYIVNKTKEFKIDLFSNSAYIFIILKKPKIIKNKYLPSAKKRIDACFKEHINFVSEEKNYKITDYLSLSFLPTDKKETIYKFASGIEPSNWIIEALEKNIKLSILEKSIK